MLVPVHHSLQQGLLSDCKLKLKAQVSIVMQKDEVAVALPIGAFCMNDAAATCKSSGMAGSNKVGVADYSDKVAEYESDSQHEQGAAQVPTSCLLACSGAPASAAACFWLSTCPAGLVAAAVVLWFPRAEPPTFVF